jgi:sec-independent protein translocase protein TatA
VFDPSPLHIILLLLIVLLLVGTKKLPEVGRSLGRGIREFRGSVTGHETHAPVSPPSEPAASAPGAAVAAAEDGERLDRTPAA